MLKLWGVNVHSNNTKHGPFNIPTNVPEDVVLTSYVWDDVVSDQEMFEQKLIFCTNLQNTFCNKQIPFTKEDETDGHYNDAHAAHLDT